MKTLIIIGHNKDQQGASAPDHIMTEYEYNCDLAKKIKQLFDNPVDCEIIKKDISNLTSYINKSEACCAVELHCNAFDGKTRGTETLYTSNHKLSSILAYMVYTELCTKLERKTKQCRGTKYLYKDDRGWYNLANLAMPAIIIEPAYIDNRYEFIMLLNKMDIIANSVYNGIKGFYNNHVINKGV
jgi:N-acetylmuramoyl-L-alanine amidase